ncbi:hypothetical protein CEXT_296141 [Caerostris extrusa]|uniref:Uncharacterized protein n=1 Tax=Caerostris extrusa TaxID=172846 RepID=A0AAV4X3H7_CAEEX|nr:hypothetical protein CEXT_296141 [Caerostris extrusa]
MASKWMLKGTSGHPFNNESATSDPIVQVSLCPPRVTELHKKAPHNHADDSTAVGQSWIAHNEQFRVGTGMDLRRIVQFESSTKYFKLMVNLQACKLFFRQEKE